MLSIILLVAASAVAVHASLIDWHSFRLPNTHTLTIGAINGALLVTWTTLLGWRWQVAIQSLVVTIVAVSLALLPARVFGMGDAKFVAACAPVMLWWGSFGEWMVLSGLAACVGSVGDLRFGWKRRIAFGPYLTGAWMLIVMGQLAGVALAYGR